jgi:D-aminopeptidase
MPKGRLRDLGIKIGVLPPGPLNAITDIPGVLVGQTTLIEDQPFTVRTGVTAVYPRQEIHLDFCFAAVYSFNGIGEMTGLPFISETGMLTSPVVLTNTHAVGLVYDTLVRYGATHIGGFTYLLPVVAETYDGWLNDADSFPLQAEHVIAALESASGGPVPEGSTGGGTGMICYEFKGGTGTASRQAEIDGQVYTVGALVQANHGERASLQVDGFHVGQYISADRIPLPWSAPPLSSSIIVLIGTDAPLLPNGCFRLAQRATVGLARTGGYGLATSGDIFLAFSTGIHYDPSGKGLRDGKGLRELHYLSHFSMDPLVIGAAEAVEEAILNAVIAAETMTGYCGRTVYGLPLADLLEAVGRKRPGGP